MLESTVPDNTGLPIILRRNILQSRHLIIGGKRRIQADFEESCNLPMWDTPITLAFDNSDQWCRIASHDILIFVPLNVNPEQKDNPRYPFNWISMWNPRWGSGLARHEHNGDPWRELWNLDLNWANNSFGFDNGVMVQCFGIWVFTSSILHDL